MSDTRLQKGLRIGVISYDFDPPIGGLGVLAKTYVETLRKLFSASSYTVLSPSPNADDRGPWLGYARWKKSGGCPLFSLVLSFALPSLIRRHELDVLHLHAGSGGAFLLRKPSCPLVVTAHHTYRQEADMVFQSQSLKRRWKIFMSFFERRTYSVANLITCVSDDTAAAIHRDYGIPREKIVVIENPVPSDIARVQPLPDRNPDEILFVGRLEKRKGIMTLLEAFHSLSKKYPSYKLRLVGRNLIGDTLKTFLGSRQIENRVTSLGYVEDPLRLREMARAAVLVVPSTLEGFGLVAAEGMLLSTCIIASDAPGLQSIIENGRTGLVFPAGDADALARCLEKAMTEPELRLRLGQAAKEEAMKRFNAEDRARDLQSTFESLGLRTKK